MFLKLVWFSGISTIVGYQCQILFYKYIKCMICKHIFYIHTQLNDQTVLILTIQFNISQQS